ncbi:DUF4288 domain-containing protein [Microbulbifer variabilis]|uniref:DUF4288 domain-containing protein n=1 Tax=Microbulbifer variabilis TaxID=266805 RepID=UPI0003611E7C|nr:DUF4288 domain-containing protein [Microbulbifer variabilis]
MKKKDRSPVDWYLVSAILSFEKNTEESHDYRSVWENTYLVRANSPQVAFDKGLMFAKNDEEKIEYKGKPGTWKLKGIREVLPIYESLEDGSEIMWTDRGKMNFSEIDSKVISKEEFEQKLNEET